MTGVELRWGWHGRWVEVKVRGFHLLCRPGVLLGLFPGTGKSTWQFAECKILTTRVSNLEISGGALGTNTFFFYHLQF
jgi:hypothetical protein